MSSFSARMRSERGAIFIHAMFTLLFLLGFLAVVADYGVLMVSRNQSQAAADAAALSGAHALS